jgi:hypothetical protein
VKINLSKALGTAMAVGVGLPTLAQGLGAVGLHIGPHTLNVVNGIAVLTAWLASSPLAQACGIPAADTSVPIADGDTVGSDTPTAINIDTTF